MKVLSIIGARPQFIKAAPVSRALRNFCQEILLHTGQHYDDNMSQVFFDELDIPKPDISLGIGGGSHAEQTAQMMVGVEQAILREKPDWVLVYGDTNSTIAGGLAAAKLHVRVAHVEAGLRSYNRSMPEEVNRVICDHVSNALFCPTDNAARNLEREGIIQGVYITGDVMYDAVLSNLERAHSRSTFLERLGLKPKSYNLATIHRAGNTDLPERLGGILFAFSQLDASIVFPVHPRTQKIIESTGLSIPPNVIPIEPLGYLDMLHAESNADCILTDSGGVQKEAFWLGVRCITLRAETEWVETVHAGWNRLVDVNPAAIVAAFRDWRPLCQPLPIYGDGHAAEKISMILKNET